MTGVRVPLLIPSPAPEEDTEVAQEAAGAVLEEMPGEAPGEPARDAGLLQRPGWVH